MEETIRILPCGDSALTLVLGDRVSEAVHRRVKAMELALRRAALPGVLELVPTYTTVCVHYDPCRVLFCQLEAAIRKGARGLLKEVSLFDIYRGVGIQSGKKSVAFNLILRADDRSLTAAEADEESRRLTALRRSSML